MGAFLDAFRSKRVGVLVALGFASGLPLALTDSTLSAWMTQAGVDLKTIGIFAAVGLPYSLKVLWAPLLDRYRLPWLGRRRGWVFLSQLGLLLALVAMSRLDPSARPGGVAAIALVIAFFSSSQDIVSDAYRTDVLPANERASGTATFIMGYRVAMLLSQAGALYLAALVSWSATYLVMGVLMAIGLVATWLAPEPEAVRPPRTLGDAFVQPFVDFFSRRGAVLALAFLMLYKFGDYLASRMIMPFLIKTGFSLVAIATLNKVVGFAGTIVGVMLGGGLVAKYGVRRALLTFGILQAATNAGYLALAIVGKNEILLAAAIATDTVCGGMATAAFSAYQMSLCSKAFSATQFALLTSASTVAGRLVSMGSGYMVAALGWATFFAITMVGAIPALLLLFAVPKDMTSSDARAARSAAG
jgi:PAT family beta-lactamase induction signal transducer AmpG